MKHELLIIIAGCYPEALRKMFGSTDTHLADTCHAKKESYQEVF
jgi:hypothetical protein